MNTLAKNTLEFELNDINSKYLETGLNKAKFDELYNRMMNNIKNNTDKVGYEEFI